jgi:predicted permease
VVAAGNGATLVLARGATRSRETAIRFALGSTRWRILREYLIESLLLASGAAVVGFLLASWTSKLAPVALNVESLPEGVTSAPDSRALVVTIGLAVATGIGIWAASALRVTRRSAVPALVGDAGMGGRPGSLRWHRGVVVAQVSLSLVLLCASAVLSRSLVQLLAVDPGFPVNSLYNFTLYPGQAGYDGTRLGIYLAQVLEEVGAIPGVSSASMTTTLPLSGDVAGTDVIGDLDRAGSGQPSPTDVASIGPFYFRTLAIPLIAGREFTPEDAVGAVKVAVLNESLARVLFGDADPIGHRVGFGGERASIQVVGVVKDIKARTLRASPAPGVFVPALQEGHIGRMSFVLRTGQMGVTLDQVRAALRRVDPAVPLVEFDSLTGQIARSLRGDRMMASLSFCFSGLAALLCGIGVFGLTSFTVTRRTREIGVRIALGATRQSIHRLMLKEVVLLTGAGCLIGLTAFMALSSVLSSRLFEVAPRDPASLVLATVVLGGATLLAAFLPAHRAARLEAALTLRQD